MNHRTRLKHKFSDQNIKEAYLKSIGETPDCVDLNLKFGYSRYELSLTESDLRVMLADIEKARE